MVCYLLPPTRSDLVDLSVARNQRPDVPLPFAEVAAGGAVFAVIPVHNRVQQTLRCLDALAAGTVVPTAIVVDDGSSDGTSDLVRRRHPDATVLRGDGSLWWAGATNLGVEHALAHGADYVLTLNNDGVLDSGAVEALLAQAGAQERAVHCCWRLDLDHPGQARSAGVVFEWESLRIFRRVAGGGDEPILVDACGGNAMLVPRPCFEEIGLFDADGLPQCWADWDFQLRAGSMGWPVYCVPGSVLLEDLSTVGPRRAPAMRLGDALRLIVSKRSPYHLVYASRFFRRHAPPGRFPAVISRRYLRLARSVVRRYVA